MLQSHVLSPTLISKQQVTDLLELGDEHRLGLEVDAEGVEELEDILAGLSAHTQHTQT